MQRASLYSGLIATAGFAVIVGCAVGTDPEAALGEAELANLTVEAGDENSIVLPSPSRPDEDAGTEEDAGAATDSGTKPDAGGTDSGTTPPSCVSPNTCATSTDLLSVSGDRGADAKTFQGSGSQWFKVRVTEDDNSVAGAKLKVRAELQSPTGMNFDLYVYRAGGGSGQECAAVTTSSTSEGGFDSASTSWGEGSLSNASSDDRTVTVEVRHVSGTCAPASQWTLTVRGNKL